MGELGGAEVVIYAGEGRPRAEHSVAAELAPERLPDRRFTEQFRGRFGRDPGPFAAYGYEAMALALQAIGAANTNSDQFRTEVRDGVIGSERRESVLGPYSITDEGDSTFCMVQRYRVRDGRPQPLDAPCPP
jgi:branched-chain amino acid transport system substrate-binding protein